MSSTKDPKCPACENGVEARNTIVGEFNTLCDKHQNDINGHLTSLVATPQATKPVDELDEILKLYWAFAEHYNNHPITCNCDRADFDRTKAALKALLTEARIAELTNFEPLQQDHTKCPQAISGIMSNGCIGYENAVSDFDNEKELRLTQLKNERSNK